MTTVEYTTTVEAEVLRVILRLPNGTLVQVEDVDQFFPSPYEDLRPRHDLLVREMGTDDVAVLVDQRDTLTRQRDEALREVERLQTELAHAISDAAGWKHTAEQALHERKCLQDERDRGVFGKQAAPLPDGVPGEVYVNGYESSDGLDVYRTREEAMADRTADNAFVCAPYVPAAAVEREREDICAIVAGWDEKIDARGALLAAIRARGKR